MNLRPGDLVTWSHELPSPLALPLVRLKARIDEEDFAGCVRAGLDAMNAALRWTSFVGICDVFSKLKSDHPFARRDRLQTLFPHLRRVLAPGRSALHSLQCIKAIATAYRDHSELFISPELIAKLNSRDGRLVDDTEALFALYEKPTFDRAAWSALEPVIAQTYGQLAPFTRLSLVQFNGLFAATQNGTQRCERHLSLRGYRLELEDLAAGPLELQGLVPPRLRELYLVDPERSQAVSLHPFVLFATDPDKAHSNETFLFNELSQGSLSFESLGARKDLRLVMRDESDDESAAEGLAGPIFQYFSELKVLIEGADASALRAMPGFAHRSNVLSFQRTIDFHTEAFSGRTEYFERIDHAIAGPFRCVWITGFAGYGKSALIARLAQQHPESIVYFVTPERGAANASRFLAHMCQSIIERFELSEVLPDEALGNVVVLKNLFTALLARATEKLKGPKLVLLVDGIDESSRYASRPEELIEACLPKSRDEIPERVVLIVTSRPEEVNLSHVADLKLDLEPFSREQISTILAKHGWGESAVAIAYERSDGQPIYFRFLLDAVKRGELKDQDAAELPAGITAFYDRFWSQCESSGPGEPGRLYQHILGFLTAASEPLTQADLVELLGGLDPRVREEHLRKAFAKEHVGRFVIGSRRYSLFHDTLRAFVAKKTRSDDGPYAEARRYHEMLAAWCRQTPGSDYSDGYTAYHMLHGGLARELVASIEDSTESGMFRRRGKERGGPVKIARDLRYATEAARELNSLERIFCFTLLQISMNKLKKTAAVSEAIPVLSALGLSEDLRGLIESCDKDDERWNTAAEIYTHDLSRGDPRSAEGFLPALKKIWFNAQSYSKTQLLERLLKKLPTPTEGNVRGLLETFNDLEKHQLPRVFCNAITRPRALAARLVLEQDLHSTSRWSAANQLAELANDLMAEGTTELGWKIFDLVDCNELDSGIPYLRAVLVRDPARALESLTRAKIQITEWNQVTRAVGILRAITSVAPERSAAFLDAQSPDLQALGMCVLAANAPGAYDRAGDVFRASCSTLSSVNVLACLTLLSLADRGAEARVWDHCLGELMKLAESSAINVEVNRSEIEQQLKALLPEATATMREVAGFFPEGHAALWFGLAVAGGALSALADPRLHAWVSARLSRESGASLESSTEIIRDATPRFITYLEHRRGRQALHGVLLPLVGSLAERETFGLRLRAMSPLALGCEGDLATLNPRFLLSPQRLGNLYPYLVTENGHPISFDYMATQGLSQVSLSDPPEAFALWQGLRGVKVDAIVAERRRLQLDTPEGERKADEAHAPSPEGFFSEQPIDAEQLTKVLMTSGQGAMGYEVLKANKGGASGWSVFSRYGQEFFPNFLAELPSFMGTSVYASESFKTCLVSVLDSLATDTQRDPRVRELLVDLSLSLPARLELCRWAFRNKLSDAAEAFVVSLSTLDPATLKRELVALVVPWIESRLTQSPDAAARMWEQLTGFLASRSLEFLGELQSSFDRKISRLMSSPEVSSRGLEQVAALLGPGFEHSREMIAVAVVKAGWGRAVASEWIHIDTPESVSSLLQKLGSTPVPEWLTEMLFERHSRCVEELGLNTSNTWYLFDQVGFSGWSDEQRTSVLQGMRARLESPEAEAQEQGTKVQLAEWRTLLSALESGSFTELGTEAAEPDSGLGEKIGFMAGINPRLSWKMLEAIPNAQKREARVAATFKCGIARELAWSVQTFGPFMSPATAKAMALSAMEKTSAQDWPVALPFVLLAIEKLSPRSLEHYEAAELLRAAVEPESIVVDLLRKLKDPLGWVEYFCQPDGNGYTERASPSDELFATIMESEEPRFTAQIRKMGDEAGAAAWSITSKIVPLLKKLDANSRRARESTWLNGYLSAVEYIVDTRKGDRENLLNEFLKVLASLDPPRALAWILKFEYKAYYLKDILGAILARDPSISESLSRDVLRGMEDWTRKSALVGCMSHLPLDQALGWADREKLDGLEFAMACVKARAVDAEGMKKLQSRVGQSADKIMALNLWALRTAGGVRDSSQQVFLDTAYGVYVKGRFVIDAYNQVVFRAPDDPKLFASYEQQLYSTLFALLPDKINESFSQQVREARPEIQSKLQNRFDEIRAEAVPLLFKTHPAWILQRSPEWSLKTWWPYLSDDLFAVIASLPAEHALKALSVFSSPARKYFDAVLAKVSDQGVMHECLEVLITEVLVRDASRIDMVMDLVMANLPKAGFDTLSAMANWARQFVKAKTLLGVQSLEVTALLSLLRGDVAETAQDRPRLSAEDQRHLVEIETTLRMLKQHGQDATVFENMRKRLLSEG